MPGQARDISMMVMQLLQLAPEPGSMKTTLFSPLTFLTRETMTPGSCWTLDK